MYVKMAYDQKVEGRNRKAGSVVKVDYATGKNLIHRGLAVETTKPQEAKTSQKQEPKAPVTQEPEKAAESTRKEDNN